MDTQEPMVATEAEQLVVQGKTTVVVVQQELEGINPPVVLRVLERQVQRMVQPYRVELVVAQPNHTFVAEAGEAGTEEGALEEVMEEGHPGVAEIGRASSRERVYVLV